MAGIFVKRRNPLVETIGQALLLLSFIAAVFYGGKWFPITAHPLLPTIIKCCAVGFLCMFVLVSMKSFNHFLLFLALVFSTTGDALLNLPHEQSFLHGLGAFFLGHIMYLWLFIKNRLAVADVSTTRMRCAGVLWAAAAIGLYILYPHLHDMVIPVVAYAGILILMATAALMSKYPVQLAGVGAILFVTSDTLLGLNQFITLPGYISGYIGYFVWGTYYLAQLSLTLGVMLIDERRKNFGGYRFD